MHKVKHTNFEWRKFRHDEFWRQIPAWKEVIKAFFLDHKWQEKSAQGCATHPWRKIKNV